jgi:hypothetical protein
MDLFERAANFFDRSQGRMATATNQAARIVLTAAQMRALEARQGELRAQIEQATLDLGRLTFQRWKNHGVGNDAALASVCAHIDVLNAEYQRILSDLADARAALAGSPIPPPGTPGAPFDPYASLPPAASTPYTTPPVPPMPSAAGSPLAVPMLPPRPARPARECPECYSLVPGTAEYCPSCGMRVEG